MTNTEKDIIELVITRLQTIPDDQEISVGAEGSFTKKELIQHVKKNDQLGKMFVEIELHYLQSLKNITQSILKDE